MKSQSSSVIYKVLNALNPHDKNYIYCLLECYNENKRTEWLDFELKKYGWCQLLQSFHKYFLIWIHYF